MRKASWSIMAAAILTAVVLIFTGCGEKNGASSKTINSGKKPVATSPAADLDASAAEKFRRAASRNSSSGKNSSGEKTVISGPATDPRVIIAGFQQLLEPAGMPLTDKQQERIIKVFDPASPYDYRAIFGVCTQKQKMVFVNNFRKNLDKSQYPLTDSQESRIMALGPGSKEKSWREILTPEQTEIAFQNEIKARSIQR
jgi:hypothetical protein